MSDDREVRAVLERRLRELELESNAVRDALRALTTRDRRRPRHPPVDTDQRMAQLEAFVHEHPGLRAQDIADACQVNQSNTIRVLKLLMDEGRVLKVDRRYFGI